MFHVLLFSFSHDAIHHNQPLQLPARQQTHKQTPTAQTNMSLHCNPMYYLKHAWEATNSIWGKSCIILFYSFLWLNIIGALWSLYDTTTGWDCYWGTMEPSDSKVTIAIMKDINLWILGFCLYADRGGIKFWNVFMVWIFFLVQWLIYKPAIEEFLLEACPTELQTLQKSMIVIEIWIFVAMVCAWMDSYCYGGGGTTAGGEESRPINV